MSGSASVFQAPLAGPARTQKTWRGCAAAVPTGTPSLRDVGEAKVYCELEPGHAMPHRLGLLYWSDVQ